MNELAKWAIIIVGGVLFFGWWFFIIMGAYAVYLLIIHGLKPEWTIDEYWSLTKEERKICRSLPKNERSDYIWEKSHKGFFDKVS